MPIKIAICQILTDHDAGRSAAQIVKWLGLAAKAGADVAVFPEVAVCGYPREKDFPESVGVEALRAAHRRIVRASKRHDIAAVVGTARRSERGWHNSLLIVDKGGHLRGHYDKIHPAEIWTIPGDRLPVYTLAGVPSCFLVCFDWRFPELVRLPAAAGAQVCYCCAYHNDPTYEHKMSAYAALPIARAAENTIYFVSATPPAAAADIHAGSHGRSRIIDPDGNILAEGGVFGDQLVMAEIDPTLATRRIARRSLSDHNPTAAWLAEGVKMVTIDPPPPGRPRRS